MKMHEGESKKEKKKKNAHPQPEPQKSSVLSLILKVLGLFSLIPLVFSIPFVLSTTGNYVKGKDHYLIFLWVFYTIILAFVFFHWRKNTITLNSFTTQIMSWAIFTMGAYVLLDLPRYLPADIRQVALYLWCSFTMIFNLILFFYDDTNYQEEEKKEKLKEERKKKKEEEKKKNEKEEEPILKANGSLKVVIDITIYVLFAIGLWYGGSFGYEWYLGFQERIAQQHGIPTEEPQY